MKQEKEGKLTLSPDASEISGLVEKAGFGKGNKSKKHLMELLWLLVDDFYFNSTFIAIDEAMRKILTTSDPSKRVQMIGVINAIAESAKHEAAELGNKSVWINGDITLRAARIQRSNELLKRDRFSQSRVSYSAIKLMDFIPEFTQIQTELGATEAQFILDLPGGINESSKGAATKINRWYNELNDRLQFKSDTFLDQGKRNDDIVEALKKEPESPTYRKGTLFQSNYGGLSLQEISTMEITKMDADLWLSLTEFFMSALNDKYAQPRNKYILSELLFKSTTFVDGYGAAVSDQFINGQLLSNINRWLENLAMVFVSTDTSELDGFFLNLFDHMGEANLAFMLTSIQMLTTHTSDFDYNFQQGNNSAGLTHPISHAAHDYYLQSHPKTEITAMREPAGMKYFGEIFLPAFKGKIKRLNLSNKYHKVIEAVESSIHGYDFSKEHIRSIEEFFAKNCGENFIDTLQSRKFELVDLCEEIWQKIQESGVAFLPTSRGLDVIQFEPDSTSGIVGLESLYVST